MFGYTALTLQAALDGARLDANLAATLAEGGSVSATVRTGLADTAPIEGVLQLDVHDLAWLELLPIWLAIAVVARDLLILLGAGLYHLLIGKAAQDKI